MGWWWWGSLEMKVMGCWTSGSNTPSELPQSEEPRQSALGWMLSIIFGSLERRLLRGLGFERERKNGLSSFKGEALWGG